MKTIVALAVALGTGALLCAQDVGKQKVEAPLKKAVAPARLDQPKTMYVERRLVETAKSPAPEKFDLSKTGILWHKGLDAALHQGKPVLLLQLLGNYDDVYC